MANRYFALPPLDPDTLEIQLYIVAQQVEDNSNYESLSDQSLSLYDGLEYSIENKLEECPENTEQTSVTVEIEATADFVQYDSET